MPDYTPTFAELCSAIADGGVIATLDGSVYEVNAFELRRYFNKSRALPGISSVQRQSSHVDGNAGSSQNLRHLQRH
jgi:precorrin-6B methylase 1